MPLAKLALPSVDGWRSDVANRDLKSTNAKENEAKPYFHFQLRRRYLKNTLGQTRNRLTLATGLGWGKRWIILQCGRPPRLLGKGGC